MSHPTEGELRAFLDGESTEEETARIQKHLAECSDCRRAEEELIRNQALVGEALGHLDSTPDLADARRAVEARLSRDPPRPRSKEDADGWRRPGLLRVAALAVLFLAGVSAALPGSPVNAWLVRTLGPDRPATSAGDGAGPGSTPTDDGSPDAPNPDSDVGVRIQPRDGAIRVELADVAPGTRVEIALVAGNRAGISAPRAVGFRSGPGVVGVTAPGSVVTIELPRSVPTAQVRWNERVLLRKEGPSLEFPTIMPESEGGAFVLMIPDGETPGDG